MINLTRDCKLTRVSNAVAAGTDDTTSCAVIDMQNFGSVTFIAAFGVITATAATSIKVQQGAIANMSDAADLLGTSVSVAADDDNQIVAVEVVEPLERYVRLQIIRSTANAVIDGVIAIQCNPKLAPTTHDSTTVVGTELHASPAEGTA